MAMALTRERNCRHFLKRIRIGTVCRNIHTHKHLPTDFEYGMARFKCDRAKRKHNFQTHPANERRNIDRGTK